MVLNKIKNKNIRFTANLVQLFIKYQNLVGNENNKIIINDSILNH